MKTTMREDHISLSFTSELSSLVPHHHIPFDAHHHGIPVNLRKGTNQFKLKTTEQNTPYGLDLHLFQHSSQLPKQKHQSSSIRALVNFTTGKSAEQVERMSPPEANSDK